MIILKNRRRFLVTVSLLIACSILAVQPLATIAAGFETFELPIAEFEPGMPSLYLRGPVEPAKNVILLISDGTGINHRTLVRIASGGANSKLPSERLFEVGLANTHSLDSLVTDSAASATQIATGNWVPNRTISVNADGEPLQTILELAKTLGKSTGIITTDRVTGATPAGFAGHVPDRDMKNEIAQIILENDSVDVLIGGGKKNFQSPVAGKKGDRTDGRDLLEEAAERGVTICNSIYELRADDSPRTWALLSSGSMTAAVKRNYTLGDLTSEALRRLSQNPEGFFLMVERDQIDGGGHDNDIWRMALELLDFETAVEVATEFAENRDDTLVIVVSDHETGGLAITNGQAQSTEVEYGWIHGGHTGTPVAIYSSGPNSFLLGGHIYLADISKIIAFGWDIYDFGPDRAVEGPGAKWLLSKQNQQ